MHAPTGYATKMHPTATETAAAKMHSATPEAAAAAECHRGRCNGDRRSERSCREVSKGFAFHDSDPPPQDFMLAAGRCRRGARITTARNAD
jgi:hypothetical protein